MTSSRLHARARAYMQTHPGTLYTEALAILTSNRTPDRNDPRSLLTLYDTSEFTSRWADREFSSELLMPVGYAPENPSHVVEIDLARYPHGVIQGHTGSGKSRMIPTVVLGLAMAHSPEKVTIAYTSPYGKSLVGSLERLPHLLPLNGGGAEFLDFITEEMDRRARILDHHKSASVDDYLRLRILNPDLPPLPHLVTIVDEYSHHDDSSVVKKVTRAVSKIGVLGRELGVHLLLSTQFLDSRDLGSVGSYMSYGVSLSVDEEWASRNVLGGYPGAVDLLRGNGSALVWRDAHTPGVQTVQGFPPLASVEAVSLVRRIAEAQGTYSAR